VGKLPRPAAKGEAEGRDVTTRKPRPKKGALKAARAIAHHESNAAADAVPPPRPGTPAHKMWRKLGLPDRPQQQLPRTREEAERQMVTPGARARDAQLAYISAARAEARGRVRGAGRLKGDDSKQTRATYAAIVAAFSDTTLLLKPIRKVQIRAFITDEDDGLAAVKPALLRGILVPDEDNDDALNRLATAFIKFLQLEQPWVREQIVKR
jgi:hypothetical protein